jgi:hypothetical protein
VLFSHFLEAAEVGLDSFEISVALVTLDLPLFEYLQVDALLIFLGILLCNVL